MASVSFLHFALSSVASASESAFTPGGGDASAGTPAFAAGALAVPAAVADGSALAPAEAVAAGSADEAVDAEPLALGEGETGSGEAGPHAESAVAEKTKAPSATPSTVFRADR